MEKLYLKLASTKETIYAERICKKAGFECSAVPTPRQFSSECAIALEIKSDDKELLTSFLEKRSIQFTFYS